MAELFPGNYVNPQYATPEQLAMQRAYAAELTKRSGENVNRPTGALANILTSITGSLERNRANEIQQEAAGRNAGDLSALIAQLQRNQVDPATAGQIYANPMASPEHRALVSGLVAPQKIEDVAGRPGTFSPAAGVHAAPVNGVFQPGFRQPMSTPDASTTVPVPAAMPQQQPLPPPTVPPGTVQGGMFGGMKSKPIGWDNSAPPPGGGPQAPVSGPPAVAAPAASSNFLTLDALAAKGRELAAERERTQGGAKAEGAVISQDLAAANDAPNVLKGVGTIKDNIQRFGDQITFGPTSPWSLEIKRAAANYAPGMMKNQLEAIAAADSINKVGIGLAGVLASQLQGGNNAETFAKSMQGVPGLTTSKEGALAMADMIQQSAAKSQQLGAIYRQLEGAGRLREYQAMRERFLTENPVLNPLTKNPIEMDLAAAKKRSEGGGARIISVEPAR
jgi:hypothetical protein